MCYDLRVRKTALFITLLGLISILRVPLLESQTTPEDTVASLRVADGLEITLWAAEPDVINPTNLDIDERGRIWITEAVNYRRHLFQQPDYRDEGDRITILEDTDGDGKADKAKVFDQDPRLRSPLGIAVLGNRVIVSQSPDVIVYTKDDDDNIVNREVFLTGWGGADHDHGVHAIVYGPDGNYYFNNGDRGLDVTDRGGQRVVSGPEEKYYGGSALRVRPDGTGLEVVAHNFRNPYELTIDSFGNIWQSDNDDDGNEWVRINYVMEGGNHGYWGPGGKRWREDRGSHFHQEDPGVVPTLLRTGAGSPSGITIYEGNLLPRRYWRKPLHVDNGPRVLRAYHVERDGAGFQASMEAVVDGADTWFRPADLVVAHDGSVFIADWYDAVVGGHQMKDTERGRIYRLAPPGHKTLSSRVDISTAAGRAEALASPSQAMRFAAHSTFLEMGADGIAELDGLLSSSNRILRARVLWLLGAAGGRGLARVLEERESTDLEFRVLAVRLLQRYHPDFPSAVEALARDENPQVRREVALGLRGVAGDNVSGEKARELLVELASRYDGQDRWYLEALAIGAQGQEDAIYDDLLEAFSNSWSDRFGRLLWVLHPSKAVGFLEQVAGDDSLDVTDRIGAVEALGAQASPDVGVFLAGVASGQGPDPLRAKAAERLIKQMFSQWTGLRESDAVVPAIRAALRMSSPDESVQGKALDLVGDMQDTRYRAEVAALASSSETSMELRAIAIETIGKLNDPAAAETLEGLTATGPTELRLAAVRGLGALDANRSVPRLNKLLLSEAPNDIRSEAVRVLARSMEGATFLLDLAEEGRLPPVLRTTAIIAVNGNRDVRERAEQVLPMLTTKSQEMMVSPRALLLRMAIRPELGKKVFFGDGQCSTCHNTGGGGSEKIGPDLGTIGDKMGRAALLDAMINPNAGIAPEYVTWVLQTKSAGQVRGMIVSNSEDEITVREPSGGRRTFPVTDVTERKRDPESAMPNLVGVLDEQELADLVGYMEELKAKP